MNSKNIKNNLIDLAILTLASSFITAILYYIFSQVLYNPLYPIFGGGEVFLLPRYILQQNDMQTLVFNRWDVLFELAILLSAVLIIFYRRQQDERYSFNQFLFLIFIASIGIEFSFTFLTSNTYKHIGIQAASINNGMFSAAHSFNEKLIQLGINDFFSTKWLRYLYIDMYSTLKPGAYPFVSATHPPGIFILTRPLVFLTSTGWGLAVGFINSLSIVLLGLIIKDTFSMRIAKLACIFFLVIPTVCMHSFSVIDGMPSVLIGLAILFIVKELKFCKLKNSFGHILNGLIVGLTLTLAAQFTFGHALPIIALSIAFCLTISNVEFERSGVKKFFTAVLIFPSLYFILENLISDGKIFYVTLAIERVQTVNNGLSSRQYPISQIANWIVMSVMGGIAFLPVTLMTLRNGPKLFINAVRTNSKMPSSKKDIKKFILLSTFFMSVLLICQTAVRLEVERTWHWYFLPTLLLSPYIFYAVIAANRRLYPNHKINRYNPIFILIFTQMIITLTLSISIQDYY